MSLNREDALFNNLKFLTLIYMPLLQFSGQTTLVTCGGESDVLLGIGVKKIEYITSIVSLFIRQMPSCRRTSLPKQENKTNLDAIAMQIDQNMQTQRHGSIDGEPIRLPLCGSEIHDFKLQTR